MRVEIFWCESVGCHAHMTPYESGGTEQVLASVQTNLEPKLWRIGTNSHRDNIPL
jgi:hypothetical protein